MAAMSRYSRFTRKHKHQSKIVKIDGFTFQSKAEADRYGQLKWLEQAGEVANIRVHPRFKIEHNGVKICSVVLDFSYLISREGGTLVYEDVKVEKRNLEGRIEYSTDTRHSKIGRKLLKAFYGIEVSIFYT